MKRENKHKLRSILALGLAVVLAWPNMNWSIFVNATDDAEENVYFFFDNRVVKATENAEYSLADVTEEMKTETNFNFDGEAVWKEGNTDEWNNSVVDYKSGTPDWEQRAGAYKFIRYDEDKQVYQMWNQHEKAKSTASHHDWTQNIISSDNAATYADKINAEGYDAPKGIPYGGDSIICYYESEDGVTWKRVCQDEYYYLDPDTEKVVKTNIVFIGGHGPSVTENENPNTSEPGFLLACQAEDGGSDQWNAAGNNGGGMGGGVAVSWSDDGIHWERPITVSTYDNGDQFMQADTQNNVHWSAELNSYVVLTRMTKLAGDYSGGRGVLQLKSENTLTSIEDLKTIQQEANAEGKDYREVMNDYWTTPKVALQGVDLRHQPYYAMADAYEKGYYIGVAPMLDDERANVSDGGTYGKVYNTLVWSPDLENWYYMDNNNGYDAFVNTSTEYDASVGSELYTIYATEPVEAGDHNGDGIRDGMRLYYSANPYMHSYGIGELKQYDPDLWEAFKEYYGPEIIAGIEAKGNAWLQSKAMKYVNIDYDAFAGYKAVAGESGSVTTTKFKITGDTLRIKASSTENISVAVLDANGNVVSGFENGTLDTANQDNRGRCAVTWGGDSLSSLNNSNDYSFKVTVSGDTMVYSIGGTIEAQELKVTSVVNETVTFNELGITKESGITIVPAEDLGTVTYTSNDNQVVTVDQEGYITSVGAGETTVTATLTDGRSQSVNVKVSDVMNEHNREGLWELRKDTLSVKHWTENISGFGHGYITLYNDVINALRDGAVLEIAYKPTEPRDNHVLWLEGTTKAGVWTVFGADGTHPDENQVYFDETEMRRVHYGDGISVVQFTYEALNENFRNGWETNRGNIGYGARAATEILYVKVGTRVGYEDRSNLVDLTNVINVENPGTSSFTLTEDMCKVLTWGGAIEISYDSAENLVFTDGDGNAIAQNVTKYNGTNDIAQIRYEDLRTLLGENAIVAGATINYELSTGATVYSAKVGTRSTYTENLLELRKNGYEVPSNQLEQSGKWAWLTFNSEMKAIWKEGAVLQVGFSGIDRQFSAGNGLNNLWIQGKVDGNDKNLGANDSFSGNSGYTAIIGNGMYYNAEANVMQFTYEAAVQYLSTPTAITMWSNDSSYSIDYVTISTRKDFADRSNLSELTDVVTVEEPKVGSFTLTKAMSKALTWGGAIEISYETTATPVFCTEGGTTIDGIVYNNSNDTMQITYEKLDAALEDGWNTVGSKIYYKLGDGGTITSAKVGTRATYKENLLEIQTTYVVPSTKYSVSGNQNSQLYISFNNEMKNAFVEGAVLEIGFTTEKHAWGVTSGLYENNIALRVTPNSTYTKCGSSSCMACSGEGSHTERFLGAKDDYPNAQDRSGVLGIVGKGMYYNTELECSVLQISYDTLMQYTDNPYSIAVLGGVAYDIRYMRIGVEGAGMDISSADISLDNVRANASDVVISMTVSEDETLPYDTEKVSAGNAPIILDGTTYTADWYIAGTNKLEANVTVGTEVAAAKLAREVFEVILPEEIMLSAKTVQTYVISVDGGARWQNTERDGVWNQKEYNPDADYYYIDSARMGTVAIQGANTFLLRLENVLQGEDFTWIPSGYENKLIMSSILGNSMLLDGDATHQSQNITTLDGKSHLWKELGYTFLRICYRKNTMNNWNEMKSVKIYSGTETEGTTEAGTKILVFKGDVNVSRNATGSLVMAERLEDIRYNANFYGSYVQSVKYPDSITVNGTAVDKNSVIPTGDHEVIVNSYLGNTIQKMVYFTEGDANADGEVTVADIIAAKKLAKGMTATSSTAHGLAADVSLSNGSINNDDVVVLRKNLVDAQDRTNLYDLEDTASAEAISNITSVWGRGSFTITEAMAERLKSGAIIEVGYDYAKANNDWINEKTLWFIANSDQEYKVGYTGDVSGAVAGNELLWNKSGNAVQITYDTLNTYMSSGWDEAGKTVKLESGSPCRIKYVKVGTPLVIEEEPPIVQEDRTGLYELSDPMAVTGFTETIAAAYGNESLILTAEMVAKLKAGAVLEIQYAVESEEWMQNQNFWFCGSGKNGKWQMIGFRGTTSDANTEVVGNDEMKWNATGTVVQITYETLNKYLATGWNAEGEILRYQAGGAGTIKSVTIGMREVETPPIVQEDRSNLLSLTDTVEVTDFTPSFAAAYQGGGFTLTSELAEKMIPGAVIEVSYECDAEQWMGNKTLWFGGSCKEEYVGADTDPYRKIGFPSYEDKTTLLPGELRWNDSGTIVQITYEQLNYCLREGWNNAGGWISYMSGGPCTIKSVKIGRIDQPVE